MVDRNPPPRGFFLLTYFSSEKKSKVVNVTPSTQSNLFPKLICVFHVENRQVSTSNRGGSAFYCTRMKFVCAFFRARKKKTNLQCQVCRKKKQIDNRMISADILRWKFHLFLSEPGSAQFAKVTVKWVCGVEFL